MLVFLNSKKMMGGGVVLTMEIMETMVTPETEVLKMLLNKEIKTVTAIAMKTKGDFKKKFLLLPLGLITNLIQAKVATVCPKNVKSILKITVSGVE
jgi:hypothetical protein